MLTCIACSKQLGAGGSPTLDDPDDDDPAVTPSTRHAIRTLTAQIKSIALRHCRPCSGGRRPMETLGCAYRRAADAAELSGGPATPVAAAASSAEGTPSMSGRSAATTEEQEGEAREWVAQVEPGVLITFLSLPRGGNDLRRIRFSRDIFNKWQAQRWWADNYDRVMELYNVRRFNRQGMPLPMHPRSEDESLKIESEEASPMTPPLGKEHLPCSASQHRSTAGGGMSNSSDSLDRALPLGGSCSGGGAGLASTPKLSSISGAKTETSSMDASVRTTSSSHEGDVDRCEELSLSNASDQESEWVEQDEPGVYITIRALPNGTRELRRIRFSRERFGEMHARLWWEENRARIHQQYL